MTVPHRIHLFNLVTIAAAFEIQESFPRLHRLQFKDLSLLSGVDESTREACAKIFGSTLHWLKEEGFIRYSSVTQDGSIFTLRFTEKGAQRLLSELPHGVGEASRSTGQAIADIARVGISAVSEGVVAAIITSFFGGKSE